MTTLLVRNAEALVTMDDEGTEFSRGGLFARDGWIEQVGPTEELPTTADEVIDATNMVVIPGLVNTHHHLYQSLTRAVPAAQDAGLFDWLTALYPIWMRLTPDHVRSATAVGLAELALSGCTTAFDHQYMWPNGSRIDDQFEGASAIGIRFEASRGSMSVGESSGGLPPDAAVEAEDDILADCVRAIDAFHDPHPGAMQRVVVAPCSPFSVSGDLMKESARLARDKGVRLHTHLAETADEQDFCHDQYGKRPVEFAESVEWIGNDVWFAHAVHVADDEVRRLGASGTGVAHCPTSNMRLASGIAPIGRYLAAGVPVGLGVDGSASNDSGHLLAETRMAMLMARLSVAPGVGQAGPQLSARQALRMATRGGAAVLGRSDIGSLEVGKACDFAAFAIDDLAYSGSADAVAGVIFCSPGVARHVRVGGHAVVADHQLVHADATALTREHTALSQLLYE